MLTIGRLKTFAESVPIATLKPIRTRGKIEATEGTQGAFVTLPEKAINASVPQWLQDEFCKLAIVGSSPTAG
jgi:hypothetical protein